MDPFSILTAVAKTENIAVIVLLIVCAFLCKVIVVIRKEDREDREAQEKRAIEAQTRNNVILDKLADAISDIRVAIARTSK